QTQTFNGSGSSSTMTADWAYDSFGRVTQATVSTNGGTPGNIVKNISYVWNDSITATQNSATGTYIINTPAFTDTEDGSGNQLQCSYKSYDGQNYTTGQTSGLTLGEVVYVTTAAGCADAANNYVLTGKATTTTLFDTYGNVIGTDDPDTNDGIGGHTGCTI